ncbi:Gfo/Idh/MocA family protein [Lignipirellula cremea]|uniref:Glycosyl hydrolase family 109 protein 1 n=1 Tax=Lignipirellula cremea TaxID=2528010 RepID=A0A518E1P1_9BACT|nr:Gfo/Idh/MocA family oxidoreductase [Lignipirellula cremea]QDU98008.1 Glycosyl hydrolase family 109 protein 1 precursor [Lignipirellula cremea]
MSEQKPSSTDPSRRRFLQTTTAAAIVGGVSALATPRTVHAAGSDTLKVALIGCGGRGSGAAVNAMKADKNVKLTVMADAFSDRIESAKKNLSRSIADQMDVPAERCFAGFDAYKQVMETDVDVVLLTTPPHFRPVQLEAAIAAGKHVFCEKPVAVDGPGVRSVLETSRKAKDKGLSLVSGLCWRYDLGVQETMARIKDGAIGDITAIQENYLTGALWHRGDKPEWSQMEYQVRNWLYYTWLSGDHIVEQHIHSLDKALWLNDDVLPTRCVGLGGRQVRTDKMWGNVFDHFAVCYEWDSGVKTFSYTRQMPGCMNNVEDYVLGTKGSAKVLAHQISGKDEWKYSGPKPSMYDVEHVELFKSIRNGQPINNGEYMSYSTLMAIMGREACYTGQSISSEEMLNSTTQLGPQTYEWGDVASPEVAVPGVTKLAQG